MRLLVNKDALLKTFWGKMGPLIDIWAHLVNDYPALPQERNELGETPNKWEIYLLKLRKLKKVQHFFTKQSHEISIPDTH